MVILINIWCAYVSLRRRRQRRLDGQAGNPGTTWSTTETGGRHVYGGVLLNILCTWAAACPNILLSYWPRGIGIYPPGPVLFALNTKYWCSHKFTDVADVEHVASVSLWYIVTRARFSSWLWWEALCVCEEMIVFEWGHSAYSTATQNNVHCGISLRPYQVNTLDNWFISRV